VRSFPVLGLAVLGAVACILAVATDDGSTAFGRLTVAAHLTKPRVGGEQIAFFLHNVVLNQCARVWISHADKTPVLREYHQ